MQHMVCTNLIIVNYGFVMLIWFPVAAGEAQKLRVLAKLQ
jgi:hypothetical protein